MGLGAYRNNLKTFGTTVYGLTHPSNLVDVVSKFAVETFGVEWDQQTGI